MKTLTKKEFDKENILVENEKKKEEFIKYLKIELNYSHNTIESYIKDIEQFEEMFNCKFENISQKNINEYIKYLSDTFQVSTHSRKISSLKKFYKFLNSTYTIKNKFGQIKTPKKISKIPSYISEDEIKHLLTSINEENNLDLRDRAMFEVLYASGMRISELLNLETNQLKIDEHFLLVIGKGNKERLIPISNKCINHLEAYLKIREEYVKEKTNIVFLNKNGKKLTRQGFDKILKKRGAYVGIINISAHKFRHSIATHLLNKGADLKMLQTFLGHKNISTTEIYTHVSKNKLQEEYEKYLKLELN